MDNYVLTPLRAQEYGSLRKSRFVEQISSKFVNEKNYQAIDNDGLGILKDCDRIYLCMHGVANAAVMAANDCGDQYGVADLIQRMEKLPKRKIDIRLFMCFSGNDAGFAQALSIALFNQGHEKVGVVGYKGEVWGTLKDGKKALKLTDTTGKFIDEADKSYYLKGVKTTRDQYRAYFSKSSQGCVIL